VDPVQIIILIAVIAVAGVAAGASLVVTRRPRRGPQLPPQAPSLARPGTDTEERTEPSATTTAPPVPAPEQPAEPEAPAAPTLDRPDQVQGRLVRLRARLARSNSALGKGLLELLSRDRLDEATWEEIEETLLLLDRLRTRVSVLGVRDVAGVRELLREELKALVDPAPGMDRSLATAQVGRPAVVLVVGVNGTGKTTTVGKLARVLVAQDLDVVLGAADTFRAAAADQLQTWGNRVGVPTIRSDRDGGDPAAVAFDAVKAGFDLEADVVLVDTAGRLQNKVGLMDELGKVKRVIEKQSPVDEVLLVIDATTGQNGMQQARVFAEVVNITGIVLTKLDGTAKGGIVVAVQRALGVPVKLVGLGEGPDDLAPFDPDGFVDALLS
jgi:fused signal recognition particle receptor